MAFCKNCGQQLADDAVFCANCGSATETAQQQAAPQQTAPVQAQPLDDNADVQQSRGIAWLSYVNLLFLIPLFVKKASKFCQFHVKQGATLFCTEVAYWIATGIFKVIIKAIFPGELAYSWIYGYYYANSTVYNVFNWIFNLGSIFFLVLAIIGIVAAAKGQRKELPLIGKIPFIATLLDKIYAALNK